MGPRRKGRELALQALYQQEITGEVSDRALRLFWENFESTKEVKDFALSLVEGVTSRRVEVDTLVAAACQHWRLERLSKIDLNILRLATFELLIEPPVPVNVVINEAIEIARRFGSGESTVFVNGVLDEIAGRLGLKMVGPETGEPPSDEAGSVQTDEGADKFDG